MQPRLGEERSRSSSSAHPGSPLSAVARFATASAAHVDGAHARRLPDHLSQLRERQPAAADERGKPQPNPRRSRWQAPPRS
jgi:hypothetical protein